MTEQRVLIVGAGPVGLLTALKLAQADITTDVIEQLPERSTAPRAAGHYGAAFEALKNAKLYDKLLAAGHLENGFGWRAPPAPNDDGGKSLGKELGVLNIYQNTDTGTDPPLGGMLILPQPELTQILEQEVLATGKVRLHYSHELMEIDDTADRVQITTRHTQTGDLKTFTGRFLVGADGGRSRVRKLKGIEFPGHTWPERFVATDVWMKNEYEVGDTTSHFVIAPVNWGVVISLTEPVKDQYSLWRYTIAVAADDPRSDEEVLDTESIVALYDKVMAGKRPLQHYEVLRKAIYRSHQRLAATMVRGRCLLAGDAAHLCNVSTHISSVQDRYVC